VYSNFFAAMQYPLMQGFPAWGTFKVGDGREKYIYILFISKYLYVYQRIFLSKIIIYLFLNIQNILS